MLSTHPVSTLKTWTDRYVKDILDYKPDGTEQTYTINQLELYATLLSMRTGIPKNMIRRAWFNEREYVENYGAH